MIKIKIKIKNGQGFTIFDFWFWAALKSQIKYQKNNMSDLRCMKNKHSFLELYTSPIHFNVLNRIFSNLNLHHKYASSIRIEAVVNTKQTDLKIRYDRQLQSHSLWYFGQFYLKKRPPETFARHWCKFA
jgi:hypothetical protein